VQFRAWTYFTEKSRSSGGRQQGQIGDWDESHQTNELAIYCKFEILGPFHGGIDRI